MPHVIVMKPVSRALGNMLAREPLLKVLNRLYDQLQNQAKRWRRRRNPVAPDDCFDYPVHLADEDGQWHTLRFVVNDRQADGFLFVVSVSHRQGKSRL